MSTTALEARNEAIYKAIQDGATQREIAERYRLSPRTVRAINSRMTERYASLTTDAVVERTGTGPFAEAGVAGLKEAWGYIHEEFLRELKTPQARYRVFDEMRNNSPVVAAMLSAIELSIKRVEWHVECEEVEDDSAEEADSEETDGEDGEGDMMDMAEADADPEDDRAAFVESCLYDMSQSFSEHLGEALTMNIFGFAPFEIVYKRRQGERGEAPSQHTDGRIGWRKFAFRSQDSLHRWDFDENGSLKGMYQQAWNDYKLRYMPIEKMLLYRTTSEKGNPEGRSLLRAAYVPYYYVKNLQSVEAIGAERDLAGLPVIEMPEKADTQRGSTDMDSAEAIVRRIRMDEQSGAVIPFGWKLSLLSSPGAKQVNIGELIARYEKRIAMVAMAQFLMLGMDQVGAYSLSKDHSDFFLMAISSIADTIAETFNKYAIPRLLKLNGMSTINPPKLVHGTPSEPDASVIGEFLSKMGNGGFIKGDDELEKWLRTLINAPELTDEVIAQREADKQAMQEQLQRKPADGESDTEDGKPGDGETMGDGGDMPMGDKKLKEQMSRYASGVNTIRKKVKSIPDKRTRTAILSGSKALQDLNKDLLKRGIASVKAITEDEWQTAAGADDGKG